MNNLYVTIVTLEFLDLVVDKMGPITLDTCIVSHGYLERPEIILTIGRKNHHITVRDVLQSFKTLTDDMFDPNRSYDFQGIGSGDDGTYFIMWGS